MEILYHLGKANVVVDALSGKRNYGIVALLISQRPIMENIRKLNIVVATESMEVKLAKLRLQPTLID